MRDDMTLVREFAAGNSETAFAALVERHIALVHSAALRQTGDAHLAQEITQAVFIILARKAATLGPKTVLTAWLYRTTHYAAADARRASRRRQIREQEAFMQSTLNQTEAEAWTQLAPLLDDALNQLGETDRTALVLRFFENKSAAEIAVAMRMKEDAAQKRVARALEKLRALFVKSGVTLTATVIAGAVTANSVQAAPVGVAVTVAAATAKDAAVGGSTLTIVKGALKIMAWTKIQTAIVISLAVLLSAGISTVVVRLNQPREPMYQGKLLSVWLKDYDNTKEVFANNGAKLHELDKIVKEAGTDAIPTLLQLLRDEDFKEHDFRSNGNEASNGFRVLGATAKDAVPALIKIYEQNPAARADDLYCLNCIGPSAEEYVPWLLQKLPDSSGKVRRQLIITLGEIHAQPDQVVPALINCLNDSDSTTRAQAALALGRYGKDATQAIPKLIDLLNDQIKGVSMKAAFAIKEIDSEAAAKAGLK